MPHLQLPTKYIYWQKVENHKNLKNKYMPIIDKIEEENKLDNPYKGCTIKNISIKNTNINTFIDTEDWNEIVWKPLENFFAEINNTYEHSFKLNATTSIISGYWFNTYDKDDFQEYHNHVYDIMSQAESSTYPTLSGIYILNDENEKSSIMFRTSNNEYTPFIRPFELLTFDTSKKDEIGEGTVLLFPIGMEHMVKKCVIPGRRTIAFNIWSRLN